MGQKVEYMIGGYSITINVDGTWYLVPLIVLIEYGITLPWGWNSGDLRKAKEKILASPLMGYIKAFKLYSKGYNDDTVKQ